MPENTPEPSGGTFEFQDEVREQKIEKVRNELFELANVIQRGKSFEEFLKTTKEYIEKLGGQIEGLEELEVSLVITKESLEDISQKIQKLKETYPKDKEVEQMEQILENLKMRYKNEIQEPFKNWPAIKEIEMSMEREVEPFMKRKMSIQEATEKLPANNSILPTLAKLKKDGVEVEYVIPSQNTEAPVLIVAPQSHPPINLALYSIYKEIFKKNGIENSLIKTISRSQQGIIKGIHAGGAKHVFLEGMLHQKTNEISFYKEIDESWQQFEKKLTTSGLESPLYFQMTAGRERVAFQNLYMADGAIDRIFREDIDISAFVIGEQHELDETGEAIPISGLFAAGGINVIVLKNKGEIEINNKSLIEIEQLMTPSMIGLFLAMYDFVKENGDLFAEHIFKKDPIKKWAAKIGLKVAREVENLAGERIKKYTYDKMKEDAPELLKMFPTFELMNELVENARKLNLARIRKDFEPLIKK